MSHGFAFTDPFALFDEIFGQEFPEWRHRRSHFHGHSQFMDFDPFFSPFSNPLNRSPLGLGGLLATMERDTFGLSGGFPSRARSFPALEPQRHRRERGVIQESFMTQTINGVTQSVHKKRDMDVSYSSSIEFSLILACLQGNEHVTRTFPDGRRIYTVNGVEQPVHGYLPSDSKDPRHMSITRHDARASSSQAQPITVVRSDFSPPSPYVGYEPDAYNAPREFQNKPTRHGC